MIIKEEYPTPNNGTSLCKGKRGRGNIRRTAHRVLGHDWSTMYIREEMICEISEAEKVNTGQMQRSL